MPALALGLAITCGLLFWGAMLIAGPWLLISASLSRDWDCAFGGLTVTLLTWGFTFLALANMS
jgi:hypothetical protein